MSSHFYNMNEELKKRSENKYTNYSLTILYCEKVHLQSQDLE